MCRRCNLLLSKSIAITFFSSLILRNRCCKKKKSALLHFFLLLVMVLRRVNPSTTVWYSAPIDPHFAARTFQRRAWARAVRSGGEISPSRRHDTHVRFIGRMTTTTITFDVNCVPRVRQYFFVLIQSV